MSRIPVLMRLVLAGLSSLCGVLALAADEPAGERGFQAALDEILRRSTQVVTQEAQLDAARARAVPARLQFVPDLRVSALTERQRYADGPSLTGSNLEAISALNLFRFGGDAAGVRAADSDIDTEEAQLETVRLDFEARGVEALVSVIRNELQSRVSRRIVGMQGTSLKIARERYSKGLLPLQEAEKISVDLDNSQARLADSELTAISARGALAALLGDAQVRIEWPWLSVFSDSAWVESQASRKLELQTRPDWRAARLKLDAEEARLSQARARIWPSVDAGFRYGWYDGVLGSGSSSFTGWTGSLSATIPLFDRLSSYSGIRVQAAARQSADSALEETAREARSEWLAARDSFRIAASAALARERTLSVSRKLFEDGLRRFQAGRLSANELNLDQARLLDSELFAIQGWSAAHLAYSRLCRALGVRVLATP